MSTTTSAWLSAAGLQPDEVGQLVRAALAEDLGQGGDVTSRLTVPPQAWMTVRYVTRQPGVVAGMPVLAAVVEQCPWATADGGAESPDAAPARLTALVSDGDRLTAGQPLAELTAPARQVLAVERTSLNVLGHLCGVATATRAWADALAGTGARVRDTRKTAPLLRALAKYAVRCGGGVNHRAGLDDAVLIKDNHIWAAGGVAPALDAARAGAGDLPIQVEVDDLQQLVEALDHGATQVLLDNFDVVGLRRAVQLIRSRAPQVVIEASGGLRLHQAAEVGATGVDYLAVGAITHSAPVLDIGLDAVPGDTFIR